MAGIRVVGSDQSLFAGVLAEDGGVGLQKDHIRSLDKLQSFECDVLRVTQTESDQEQHEPAFEEQQQEVRRKRRPLVLSLRRRRLI